MVGLAVLATCVAPACHRRAFAEKSAVFVAYNESRDEVVAIIDGANEYNIAPSGSARFTVKILVPYNDTRVDYGPSTIDKEVDVSVAFRNVATGKLTTPITCRAGAKVVTTIWYQWNNGFPYGNCTST